MAGDSNTTNPPWWTLAQIVVWILQQIEIPPQDAEQFCNALNPKIVEGALNALTRTLLNAVYGPVEGMPIVAARVLCGHRHVDLATLCGRSSSLESGALDALRYEIRQLIGQPGVEFNPLWGKRATRSARVPAAQAAPTPTRPTEPAVADEAEPIPGSKVEPEESPQVASEPPPEKTAEAPIQPKRRGAKEKYDWDVAMEYLRGILEMRGDPLNRLNADDGWRSEADAGRLIQDFMLEQLKQPLKQKLKQELEQELKQEPKQELKQKLKRELEQKLKQRLEQELKEEPKKEPDFSNVMRHVRPELEKWREREKHNRA